MMPKPCAQPGSAPRFGLNSASAQPTGPGLTASNRRNRPNRISWPSQPAGITSHRMIQNAMISSHTTGLGSATAIARAVSVQAHQPTKKPATRIAAQAQARRRGEAVDQQRTAPSRQRAGGAGRDRRQAAAEAERDQAQRVQAHEAPGGAARRRWSADRRSWRQAAMKWSNARSVERHRRAVGVDDAQAGLGVQRADAGHGRRRRARRRRAPARARPRAPRRAVRSRRRRPAGRCGAGASVQAATCAPCGMSASRSVGADAAGAQHVAEVADEAVAEVDRRASRCRAARGPARRAAAGAPSRGARRSNASPRSATLAAERLEREPRVAQPCR